MENNMKLASEELVEVESAEAVKLTKERILALDSGMYDGTNGDGEKVVILRQVGCGYTIQTPTHNGWHECVDYDEDGEIEGVRYEK